MKKTNAKDGMKEMTMMLMYLSRFTDGEKIREAEDFYAWKGYDFDIINEFDDEDYIRQGSHPSRSKSVYLTTKGMSYAKELLNKYGIHDWNEDQNE